MIANNIFNTVLEFTILILLNIPVPSGSLAASEEELGVEESQNSLSEEELGVEKSQNSFLLQFCHDLKMMDLSNVSAQRSIVDLANRWSAPVSNLETQFNCELCMEPLSTPPGEGLAGENNINIKFGCDHLFHRICLKKMFEADLDAQRTRRECPVDGCTSILTVSELSNAGLTDKQIEQLLITELSRMESLVICKKCGLDALLKGSDGNSINFCRSCKQDLCFECGTYHQPGTICGHKAELLHDLLSEIPASNQNNLRCCPKCWKPISKNAGCQDMICGRNYDDDRATLIESLGCGCSFRWNNAPRISTIQSKLQSQLNLQESHNNRTLWVAGLNGVSEEEIRTLFEEYGEIENIQIRRPKRKGSRFGLITFTDSQNARQALQLNHRRLNGNKIKIQWNKN